MVWRGGSGGSICASLAYAVLDESTTTRLRL
jgi:hypothetical protein